MSEVTIRKIWSNEYHNAFTSLIQFNNNFYCSFRQGDGHEGGDDGSVQVIKSKNGNIWEPVTVLEKKGYDLRDPKLSVTPDGRIMVIMGGSVYKDKKLLKRLSQVSFSDNSGNNFSDPLPIKIPDNIKTEDDWLWRVTWHQSIGYGVLKQYSTNPSNNKITKSIALLKTYNGIDYELIKNFEEVGGNCGESTVRIMPDGEMIMMVRRDIEGLWGWSRPPYMDWKWIDVNIRFGGPDFMPLNEEFFIAGTRVYVKEPYTGLFLVGRAGKFREILHLPSGGDNSYPGIVVTKTMIYLTYYSSHDGNTSIYFVEIPRKSIEKMIIK